MTSLSSEPLDIPTNARTPQISRHDHFSVKPWDWRRMNLHANAIKAIMSWLSLDSLNHVLGRLIVKDNCERTKARFLIGAARHTNSSTARHKPRQALAFLAAAEGSAGVRLRWHVPAEPVGERSLPENIHFAISVLSVCHPNIILFNGRTIDLRGQPWGYLLGPSFYYIRIILNYIIYYIPHSLAEDACPSSRFLVCTALSIIEICPDVQLLGLHKGRCPPEQLHSCPLPAKPVQWWVEPLWRYKWDEQIWFKHVDGKNWTNTLKICERAPNHCKVGSQQLCCHDNNA